MKLTGELKDKVDQAKDLEEAKEVIAGAGMLLSDDEVSEVAGGNNDGFEVQCPYCGYTCSSQERYEQHKNKYHWDAGDPDTYYDGANPNYRVL